MNLLDKMNPGQLLVADQGLKKMKYKIRAAIIGVVNDGKQPIEYIQSDDVIVFVEKINYFAGKFLTQKGNLIRLENEYMTYFKIWSDSLDNSV